MKQPNTPFPTTGYYGKDYFCDRESELDQLMQNVRGGLSTTLVALRRMGKTALIRHLQGHLSGEFINLYIDLLPTESLNDFLNSLATAVASLESEKAGPGKQVWKFLRSLRPVVTFDSLSGNPGLSFNLDRDASQGTVGEIFAFLESRPKPVLLAIDEFQQVLHYPEKQVDAWLRTRIQGLKNVTFLFSGSQQHLMRELFADPSRPFFRSTQFLKIGPIDRSVYHRFISGKFAEASKKITDQTITEILDWTLGFTYYTQLMCNRVWVASGDVVGEALWRTEAEKVLSEQEFVFYSYRDVLTTAQWNLLKAIAREETVQRPTSTAFLKKHGLGNSASVLRSLETLKKKEMIFQEQTPDGTPYYGVYDILFMRWIKR